MVHRSRQEFSINSSCLTRSVSLYYSPLPESSGQEPTFPDRGCITFPPAHVVVTEWESGWKRLFARFAPCSLPGYPNIGCGDSCPVRISGRGLFQRFSVLLCLKNLQKVGNNVLTTRLCKRVQVKVDRFNYHGYTNVHVAAHSLFFHRCLTGIPCQRVRRPIGLLPAVSVGTAEKIVYRSHVRYRSGLALLVGSRNAHVASSSQSPIPNRI